MEYTRRYSQSVVTITTYKHLSSGYRDRSCSYRTFSCTDWEETKLLWKGIETKITLLRGIDGSRPDVVVKQWSRGKTLPCPWEGRRRRVDKESLSKQSSELSPVLETSTRGSTALSYLLNMYCPR